MDENHMFVVDEGELEVLYGDEVVATLSNGSAFGEIALMYGCPRTATIKVPGLQLCLILAIAMPFLTFMSRLEFLATCGSWIETHFEEFSWKKAFDAENFMNLF